MPVLEFSWNFFPGIFLASWNFPGILAFWQKFYDLLDITIRKDSINRYLKAEFGKP